MRIRHVSCRRLQAAGLALHLTIGLIPLVALTPASAEEAAEEIIVTATPRRQSADDLAQSVTVVSGDVLERIRAANLGETLESQLGMSATSFGAGASRPIIRGLAGPRVRTLEDGIDSMDVSTVSVDHAVSVDPLAARQVEIFRGPTTLLYGSGAVGGIINTVTNRIPIAAPADGLEGAVEIQGNTAAEDRAVSLTLDGGGNALAWHFDAAGRETGDYEIPGFADVAHDEISPPEPGNGDVFGRVDNSDIELKGYAGGMSWLGDRSSFGVAASSFDSNYGLPGHHEHEGGGAEPEADVRVDLGQTRFDFRGGWTGMDGPVEMINVRFGINDYAHVELEGDEIGTRFANDAYEGRFELMHSPWGSWQGAAGVQIGAREFSAIGDEAFVPPTDSASIGVFMVEQREAGRWNVSLGGRVERQKQRPGNGLPQADDRAESFSFAAMRALGSEYSLSFNLADAERLPGTEELYSNGPHLATHTIEIGDPALGPERSQHLDVSIRKTGAALTWAFTGFMTGYADYIYLRDTGAVDPVGNLPVFVFTQGDARLSGLEAELSAPLAEIGAGVIDVRIFADTVDGELDAGGHLPQMPPRRAGARLQYGSARITTGIEATRYADQDRIAEHETPTAGYTMLNADLQWTLGADRGTTYALFLRGTNLLDEDARRHTSFLKNELPLPGRNYSMGIRARF
jgi:iron complex outermembrane receptor protein